MANWQELLEGAVAEGLCAGWRMEWFSSHAETGYRLYDASGVLISMGPVEDLVHALAGLRRARRKPVAEMDADELDTEARAFGCVFDGGDIRCNHRGERFYRVADEPLTAFLRRVVTRIREQETN